MDIEEKLNEFLNLSLSIKDRIRLNSGLDLGILERRRLSCFAELNRYNWSIFESSNLKVKICEFKIFIYCLYDYNRMKEKVRKLENIFDVSKSEESKSLYNLRKNCERQLEFEKTKQYHDYINARSATDSLVFLLRNKLRDIDFLICNSRIETKQNIRILKLYLSFQQDPEYFEKTLNKIERLMTVTRQLEYDDDIDF